jgi:hypothetical protein
VTLFTAFPILEVTQKENKKEDYEGKKKYPQLSFESRAQEE